MERVFTPGQTKENTKENGEATKCMVKGYSLGLMEESITVNTLRTKRRAMGNFFGLTVDATEENGSMENSTAREHMSQAKVKKNTENGKRVRESDGSGEEKWNERNSI